ncbi:MAG: NTP transferase domain-containing protein [Clostridia bacterium]|nr:NTP transferase domain-containing protein [Clostridia bacterium]
MKAIVMAGGEGTRLRPITEKLPKPCAEVGGVPVLKRILEMLEKNGVTQAVLTLMHLPETVRQAVGDRYGRISLSSVVESPPLGTAGSVANAVDAEGWQKEELIVISGDGLCDFDLSEALECHRRRGADATLLLTQREEPLEYGVVLTDEAGRITGFVEKPDWSQATSELVNTGIYIVSPRAVERIPRGRPFDFAKDLFPLLLKEGALLLGVEARGYWCDIGDPRAFLQANLDLLDGKVRSDTAPKGFFFDADTKVLCAATAKVHPSARLERCVVGENCTVGAQSRLQDCVLMSRAAVGEECRLEETVVCNEAVLERGVHTSPGCVIGPQWQVPPESYLGAGGTLQKERAYEELLSGEFGIGFGTAEALRLGRASAVLEGPIAAMSDGSGEGTLLKKAFLCGAAERGAETFDLVEGAYGVALFAGHMTQSFWAYFSCEGGEVRVRLRERDGLPLRRSNQRKFRRALKETSAPASPPVPTAVMDGWETLYKKDLAARFDLTGITVSAQGKTAELLQACRAEIRPLGRFRWADGVLEEANARRRANGEWLALLPAVDRLGKGKSICIPADAPCALEDLAAANGTRVLRWLLSCANDSDEEARRGAYENRWFLDEDFALLATLELCRERSLDEVMEAVPAFFRENRRVSVGEGEHMQVIRRLRRLQGQAGADRQGFLLQHKRGTVTVTPLERGQFFILAEAVAAETAQELCAEILEQINGQKK